MNKFFLPTLADVPSEPGGRRPSLSEAFEVAAQGVLRHPPSLGQSATKGYDVWERRENHLVAAIGEGFEIRSEAMGWHGVISLHSFKSTDISKIVKCGGIVERLAVDPLSGVSPEG